MIEKMNLKYTYEPLFLVKLVILTCLGLSSVIDYVDFCHAWLQCTKKRAEQKTAGIRTKSEQKRELRNLKCSVLRQNNHGYQMPFVVNRLFSWLTLTQRPMRARGLGASYSATQNHCAHGPGFALVEPSHHRVWVIKIWLFL